MSIRPDHWIRRMCREHRMIEPYEEKQVREGVISYAIGLLNATNPVGRWMLVALTSIIALGVAIWIGREKNRLDQAALGMVLGGALGNILDRIRFGYVVDFADLHFGDFRPFLVFNVGDAAISIAVVILLLRAFLARKDHREGPEPKETIEHA